MFFCWFILKSYTMLMTVQITPMRMDICILILLAIHIASLFNNTLLCANFSSGTIAYTTKQYFVNKFV